MAAAPIAPGQNAPIDGPNEQQQPLPQELIDTIKALRQKADARDKASRRQEIRETRMQRYFWRGEQHLAWNADDAVLQNLAGKDDDGKLRRVYNIYTGYGKSFIAVFCQNAPNTRPEPQDPKDSQAINAAEEADKMRRIIEKFNVPSDLQMEAGRLIWTDPRVVFHTRFVTDKARFGVDDQGNPRGREVTSVYGALEHKAPISLRDIHDWPYCSISTEHDVATLKSMFPEIENKIQTGGGRGEDDLERMARIAVAQGTAKLTAGGDSLTHLGTYHRYWFRPSFYTEIQDRSKRQALQDQFPEGIYAGFCGTEYAESRNEALDDHVSVMYSLPGDGQNSGSLGKNAMSCQQAFNDMMNLAEESFQYGVGATWCDEESVDIDAIADQDSAPGMHLMAKRKAGESLADSFYTEPSAGPAEGLSLFMQDLQGPLAQFLTGQQPALFGGEMEDQKTASGYAQAKNQALGLMAIVWKPFCSVYSRVMEQAVKCAANNRTENPSAMVKSESKRGQSEPIEVDIDSLSGKILWSSPTDENFPESWAEKSNKMMGLMQAAESNPPLAAILQHPANLALIKDLIGIEDFTIPGADSEDKQLEETEELLKSGPVPNPAAQQEQMQAQMAAAQGQPPAPPQAPPEISSIPIDVDYDNHAAEWAECERWVNSAAGRKAKVMNPAGFANVRLHGLLHKEQVDAAQKAAAAAAAPPPKPVDDTPSESINFKDLPPHGQLQMAAKAGIQLDPEITSAIHPAMQPPPPPPVIKPQAGA